MGTSIEERPKSIENRQEFGPWEIDTVVGKTDADEPVLLTLVERKTRFEKIFKIAGQRAHAVDKTLRTFIQSLKGLDSQILKQSLRTTGVSSPIYPIWQKKLMYTFVILLLLLNEVRVRINIKLSVISCQNISLLKK